MVIETYESYVLGIPSDDGTPPEHYVLPQPEKTQGWIRPHATFGTIGRTSIYGSPMTGYPIQTSSGTEAYIKTGEEMAGPFSMKEARFLQQLKDAVYCFTQELASGSIFGSVEHRQLIEERRRDLAKRGIRYNPQVEPGVIEKKLDYLARRGG